MAPNMIKLISTSFTPENIAQKSSNFVDFGESANPWSVFLKRFRATYIDKTDQSTDLPTIGKGGASGKKTDHHHHHHHHVGGQFSPDSSRPGSPARIGSQQGGVPSLTNPTGGMRGMFSEETEGLPLAHESGTGTPKSKPGTAALGSASKPGTAALGSASKPGTAAPVPVPTGGLGAVKFSTQQIIELTCDIFLSMWQDIHKNECDSVINLTMKVVCKRKGNQKTMDMRVKAFLDSIRSQNCLEHPYLFLFGLINGLLPRRTENIRPMLGFVANYFVILAYTDCCEKNTRYQELKAVPEKLRVNPTTLLTVAINDADLNSNNIRSKFKRHYLPKLKGVAADGVISLRKAIVMIDYVMNKLAEPHFIMSGLQGACVEYESRMPWCNSSILRLFDALFELSTTCYTASGPAPVVNSGNHHSASSLMQPGFVPKAHAPAPIDYDSMSLRAYQCLNSLVKAKWSNPKPGNDVKLDVFQLSVLFETKMKQGEGKVVGISVFAAFMMYAWEQEYLHIKALLERRAGVCGRREAMTSHYDRANAESGRHKLSVSERAIMRKIIDYFDAIGAPGIDWVMLKAPEGRNMIPFAIPDSLLQRSHIELNYTAMAMMESRKRLDFQGHLEQMQDDFRTYPQEESLNFFQQLHLYEGRGDKAADGARSIAERIEDVQRLARAKYLSEQTIDSGAPPSFKLDKLVDEEGSESASAETLTSSVARGIAKAEADEKEEQGEEYLQTLLVQVGGEAKADRLALSVQKTAGIASPLFSDETAKAGDEGDFSTAADPARVDQPPTLEDFMNSDKYIKESLMLRNSIPTMSCYAGELTINGVRKDHMSPGVVPSAALLMVNMARKTRDVSTADSLAAANLESAIEEADSHIKETENWTHHKSTPKFKAIPTAYESPAPSRKHRVSMVDTLSVKPAVLEKIKLVHPLDGQYPTDTEKFGFLERGAENEPKPPSGLFAKLGLENMVLGKGNSNASTAAASEFLELITNPKGQAARSKESQTSALILDAVNRASQDGTYLGIPNSPSALKQKRFCGQAPTYMEVGLEAVADRDRPVRSAPIFDDSRLFKDEDMSELSMGDAQVVQDGGTGNLSLHQLTIADFRNASSAIPTRDPNRMRDRMASSSCPNLPGIGSSRRSPVRSRGAAPPISEESDDEESEYAHSSASVLYRSLEPAGAHNRRILTLSHISSLRESEYPILNLEYFANPVRLGDIAASAASSPSSSRPTTGGIFSAKEARAERERKVEATKHKILEESAPRLKAFIIRDAKIDKNVLSKVVELYLRAPYLRYMSRIDLSGNCLGAQAMEILAGAFATHGCGKLKTLALGGNMIKNQGLKVLLTKGLMPGGCCSVTPKNAHMSTPFYGIMKLDLRHCGISLSEPFDKDTFAGFSTLTNLRVLDLSWNQITADSKAQKAILKSLFTPLAKLEILTLAFNRLEDEGALIIMDSVLTKNHSIRVLDLSHCFMTNPSLKGINKLLSGNTAAPEKRKRGAPVTAEDPIPLFNPKSPSQLKVLILQGNTFRADGISQVRQFATSCNKKVVMEGVHAGIDIPVKYEQLYDIDDLDREKNSPQKVYERKQSMSMSRSASANAMTNSGSRPTSATQAVAQL